jgi:hypothetical protein
MGESVSFSQETDWDALIRDAQFHRLTPSLYRACQTSNSVPDSVVERLRVHTHEHTVRSHLWSEELAWVLQRLHENQIPAIVWKGPELQSRLNLSEPRVFRDLDILIGRTDLNAAVKLLSERFQLSGARILSGAKDISLVQERSPLTIELHVCFSEPESLLPRVVDQAWKTKRNIEWQGVPAFRLDPSLEAALLCWHGSRHAFFRLRWLVDLGLLFKQELDFEKLLQVSEVTVGRRAVALPLAMLNELGTLNEQAQAALEACSDRWATETAAAVLADPLVLGEFSEKARRRRIEYHLINGFGKKAAWAATLLNEILFYRSNKTGD